MWIIGVFQSPASQFNNQPPHSSKPNNFGRWLAEIGLIPEDDLPRMAKFRKMTYREWPNPGRWLTEIGQIPAYDKLESQKRMWWNQQPKVIFRGEWYRNLYEFLNWLSENKKTLVSNFDWKKLFQKSLTALVLCSSRDIVSLKFKEKTSRVSSLLKWIEWA